jgi:uncharacterized repeat protein (TIGR03803 family)
MHLQSEACLLTPLLRNESTTHKGVITVPRQPQTITSVTNRASQLFKQHRLATLVLIGCAMLSSASAAQTVADLHSFTSNGNSQYPDYVTPAQGRDGRLYGTTTGLNYGSIFRLQTTGGEADLFAFDGTDGYGPRAGVTLGTDGNFYGTEEFGGSAGYGVLFKVTPSGTFTALHEFSGESDGGYPHAAPTEASDGNFYGTTENGAGFMGATVYKYAPSGSGTFTTIYEFSEATDYGILAPLIQGSNGNLYGTAYYGSNNCGAIFELTTAGTLVTQYNFTCEGGTNPAAPLLQASDGNFYGTTYTGSGNSGGMVFKMTPRGQVTALHNFTTDGPEGWEPAGGLVQGTDGNLYGSTRQGGSSGDIGTLFQITTSGAYTELYSFPESVGEYPSGALLQHTDGMFYGTAYLGGAYDYGAVYSLDMGLGPFVTFVRPTSAAGGTVQILGQGFTGTTAVTFNGVQATAFTVVSDTYMTAIVPSGATTGPVAVTTTGGTLTSNVSLRVKP